MNALLRNWRLWIPVGYVAAALVVTVASAAASFVYLKSKLNDSERDRAESVYREQAQRIREGDLESEKRKVGDWLVARGRLGRGSWGYEFAPRDSVLVWYREPKQELCRLAYVPKVEYAFWRGWFASFIGASLLTILLLAMLAVRYFKDFLRERDDFIAATAHDLRTPVAALSMLSRNGSEELKQTAMRLRSLVGNLTEFLNLGGKRPAPKCEKIDLVALFRESYGAFREGYEDLDRPVAIEGVAELWATGDADLVAQIFWNLLGNDLKYAAPYGAVRAKFLCDGARAVVELADEGPGMSRAAMRRCFDRYYRATTIRESGKGGFGIGLCNAREFARAMKGALAVRTNEPHGCVFTLTLPAVA